MIELKLDNKSLSSEVGEQYIRYLLKAMRAACVENKDWRKEMRVFLRAYNTTPHSTTHVSPAELMFKRTLRTELPTFRQTEDNPEMRDSVAKKQVQVQEQKAKRQASGIEPGEIIEKKGTQVTVRIASGGEYKRNISHVKKYLTSVPQDSKGKMHKIKLFDIFRDDAQEVIAPVYSKKCKTRKSPCLAEKRWARKHGNLRVWR
ncbi:hypothetical protein CAPTEDRAFT_186246 [Capitella teleta]|uniref:Integrase catalytic domain-containing protein n=1 Tax=Capitella teleta TaxID=283909 RepID=R7TY64_CAPTE|nr:hypothetical protein CAPTEDRAFT_186246 [Capitella teleta]|eukprot:ELT98689.1 hypothetical protein CAPTEDRAFT_186246 [Capitella teleta]